jgi:hypothetical protein
LGANAPNDPPGNSGGRALFGRGATVKVVNFKFSVTVLDDTGDSLKDIFWGRVLFGSVCECDFTVPFVNVTLQRRCCFGSFHSVDLTTKSIK